ncbi:methyltransferase domain-containing protein [Kitasatospora gansuensis]
MRDVFRYNWPLYAAGCLAAGTGWVVARCLPGPAAVAARAGASAAVALLVSSTAASWWVYDRSGLHSFDWLDDLLPGGPGAHVVVSAGLDEASRPLAARRLDAAQRVVDLYDPVLMTEGSIRRARRRVPPVAGTVAGLPDRLPVASGSADTVFAVFAAHELRRAADREALFAECVRVLRPGGWSWWSTCGTWQTRRCTAPVPGTSSRGGSGCGWRPVPVCGPSASCGSAAW